MTFCPTSQRTVACKSTCWLSPVFERLSLARLFQTVAEAQPLGPSTDPGNNIWVRRATSGTVQFDRLSKPSAEALHRSGRRITGRSVCLRLGQKPEGQQNDMWNNKQGIKLGVLLAWMAALVATEAAAAKEGAKPSRPNVLLIMTDDQGYGDIHSHGNDSLDTPNLDRLAEQGARLQRFFVSPVCAPTRASLLTGRYHLRCGVFGVTRGAETMRASEVTLAELLRQAGYQTACFGKWHNGAHYPHHPNGQGFDQFVGFCAGHWNNYFNSRLEENGQPRQTSGYINDVFTSRSIDFIKANKNSPWFCYLAYNTPHTPWQVPDRYWEKYGQRQLKNQQARCAYAMVENIDENVGRLLEALDTAKLADHTIVVFLTDNGANSDRYNAGMKGRKGSLHEGGSRVPCFIRFPGRIPPQTRLAPITAHIDLLPTLCDYAGVPIAEELKLDGTSLVPLLSPVAGRAAPWPNRTLFCHWGGRPNRQRANRGAVRTDRWRAVRSKTWELYDMQADPGQRTDVAKDHPQVVKDLAGRFDRWWQDVTSEGFEPIPTEIGHPTAPVVTFPGHEAILQPARGKGISYHGRAGWANDWVANWTDPRATARWPIKAIAPGKYQVQLVYAASEESVGTQLQVSIGSAKVSTRILKPVPAAIVPLPDRIARKEVPQRKWQSKSIGELSIEAGEGWLVIQAPSIPGSQAIDLKAIRLRRIDE